MLYNISIILGSAILLFIINIASKRQHCVTRLVLFVFNFKYVDGLARVVPSMYASYCRVRVCKSKGGRRACRCARRLRQGTQTYHE